MSDTSGQVTAGPARALGRLGFPRRLGTTAAVATLLTVTAMIGAVVAANSAGARPTGAAGTPGRAYAKAPLAKAAPGSTGRGRSLPRSAPTSTPTHSTPTHSTPARSSRPSAAAAPAGHPGISLALTAADHRDCPAGAAACVDLDRHVTWLQSDGRVTFGPVQMEPGKPGSKHQTPVGAFQVAWKAGPSYQSNIYHEAMPWATFFAAGGIAFHGGSLTAWSHGCVHLTDSNAHYYNEHLPIGAKVVVF
jgi:lipoprotein-anchoring transpeptidase ErfK/SrfK